MLREGNQNATVRSMTRQLGVSLKLYLLDEYYMLFCRGADRLASPARLPHHGPAIGGGDR